MAYQELSYLQVLVAVALIAINAGLSLALRLGLGKRLLLASARTVVQLLLIGLVLHQIFAMASPLPVLAWMVLMTSIAAFSAVRRTGWRYRGMALDALLAIGVGSWSVTVMALLAVVRAEPVYRPQYAIPLLGMILGNSLTGVALGLDRLGQELGERRARVELYLALGATRWQAALPAIRAAARTGMIPILNAMSVAGLVSLPGMMTGQLLAGVEPTQAVRYQIVIMFLIAASTALATVGATLLGYRRLFNRHHQFLYQRIRRTEAS